MIFFTHFPTVAIDHDFVFTTVNSHPRTVTVAGSFNSWSKDANPLTLGPDGKTWTTHIDLPYGKVQYKFVVNGDDWTLDPSAPSVSDGNGHTNSELVVVPADYSSPASPTDGVTAKSALLHEQTADQLNYDRGALQIKFRARPNDLSEVDLLQNGKKVAMNVVARDEIFATYEADVPWNRKGDLTYDFELHDGSKTAFYGKDGYSESQTEPFVLDAKTFKPFEVPNWVDKTVVYQIFPDRFADGDPTNDPKNVQPWDAKPTYSNRFGGDTAGVMQHLTYLKDLGIGAVYFTPVFASPSNHRYDATDYRKIDPQFGTNAEFDAMTQAMKKDGIRTVLDFAFNHTSPTFYAFQDIIKNGQSSAYVPWYFIKSYPVTVKEPPPYVGWSDSPYMPKLNVVNPDTEKYLLDTVDYWIANAGIDGARLDAAPEVDSKLWIDLRTRAKAELPNFWIVGEEWGDASPWLKGNQWDSTMGYQFRDACLGFFADGSTTPAQFMGKLTDVYNSYPPQVSRNLMNLLGSHDTPRFLTLCHDDPKLLELAATVEMTWPGTPCVYYGDELGMEGGVDPDNRRGMTWSAARESNPILAYYKRLIHARNQSPALQIGDPVLLKTDDATGCLAYARLSDNDGALIAVNRSASPETISITLPEDKRFRSLRTSLFDIIAGRPYGPSSTFVLNLSPKSAAVLLPRQEYDLTASTALPRAGEPSFGHRSPSVSQGANESNAQKSLYSY